MKSMWLAGLAAFFCVAIAGYGGGSAGINDYNVDGKSDLAVFDTAGGYWYIKSVDGTGILWKDQWGWSTAKPVPGDYNGDGKWDQAVFDTQGGYWYIKSVDGAGILWKNQWGWSTAKPVPGDYNGDGKWDQAVFDTVGGYWYIKSVAGNVILWKNQWGWNTAKPIPGDYDGDGKWDQAVFDTGGGYWYIKSAAGNVITWKNQWGWSTAQPVPGDYDGDGTYDLAVFDTVGGYWYIKSLAGNGITWKNQWGWSNAKPIPGDYNGDGKFDLAVYDTATGYWYIKDVDGTPIAWAVQWGWPGALPVTIDLSTSTPPRPSINVNLTRAGMLTKNEIWRGTITVNGDVTIPNGVQLTIEPGTIVKFSPQVDSMHDGPDTAITDPYFPHDPATKPTDISEIRVYGGTLCAIGTPSQPITFTSGATTPVRGDWMSISFSKINSKLVLIHTKIEYAYYGVQINTSATDAQITFSSNVVQHIVACGINCGVDPGQPVSLRITGNDISDCGHEAIDTHANAAIIIENNFIHDNQWSFGDGAAGTGVIIDGNNSLIQGNYFLRNRTGICVFGNNPNPVITNNVFLDNDEDVLRL